VALIVLDVSVVIAQLDPEDANHARVAEELERRADGDLVLPASAYAEFLVDPVRRGRVAEAQERVQRLQLRVVPLDERVAERAAELRAREQGLRLPDALVLATADALGADEVLTADRRWQRFPRVAVVG
jgi:predicted nucleic acid-binding protein